MISIDWKFVGRDYLGFFPDEYPELDFLQGADFSALCDAMANEAADSCFIGLSGFLRSHGYQLWNIDSGGDDYNLVLVADGDVDAFLAECAEDATEDFTPECERLALDAPLWVAPPPTKAKAKPKSLIAESDYHLSYGGIGHGTDVLRLIEFEEDGESFRSLVDVRTFPLTGLDAADFFVMIDEQKHGFSGLHTPRVGQYWRWEKPQKRQKLWSNGISAIALISAYQPMEIAEVPGMEWRDGAWLGAWGIGNTLFLHTVHEGDAARFDDTAPVIGPPPDQDNERAALFQISGLTARHIAFVRKHDVIVPLSETEVLIIHPDNEEQPDYVVFDCTTGAVTASGRLPAALPSPSDALHRLSKDEIVLVRTDTAPHPTHAQLSENTGWLVRINIRTGAWAEAKLDGLFNDFTINMAFLRTQAPDRHRIRSFDGFVSFAEGHDGWCVLNYLTSQSGTHDLAWFWNTRTDDIIKIRQSDFPRRTPSFFYNAALGRYVADESCRLDLLIPFDEIVAGRKMDRLNWRT